MKKSSKLTKIMMTDGIFMNSNSSNESNSDDEKYQLPTTNLIISNNNKEQNIIKRQHLTNTSSIQNDKHIIKLNQVVNGNNRLSFNESEHTNNRLYWRLSDYSNLSHQQNKALNNHEETTLIMNVDQCLEKTEWVNVKHWFTIHCHENVEFISNGQWKRFWIWLKNSNILLFNDYKDTNPIFTINTVDCLCYPLTGHGQYVFSLTTHTGETYCFQCSNQFEVNNWIYCIYSHCLLKLNKTILKSNIKQLENDIIYENKLLKLSQLQLKLSKNKKIYLFILKQIELSEKNLELFHINLFRKKCYLSIFNQNHHLPNSKDLLSKISSKTKIILYNLHAFTPCGFYAYIIARQNYQKSKLRQQIISSIETDKTIIFVPNSQKKMIVSINTKTTVSELLKIVVEKLSLTIDDYFLYFNLTSTNGFIPNQNDKIHTLKYSSIEIHRKMIYQITLNNELNLSGIEIHCQYPWKVFVSNVKKEGEGEQLGVIKGDEILRINNLIVQDLDSINFNHYLHQIPIVLTLRSSRLNRTTIDISQTISSTKLIAPINKNDHLSSIFTKTLHQFNRFSRPIINILNTNNQQQSPIKSLSNTQQIPNVIHELIETERSYIQDLQCLLNQYIEPLRDNSTILSSDIIESLYNSIKSIHQLQIIFFENLQSSLLTENILISIAETFINSSKNFKLYSTYCIIHLQINRLLNIYQNNQYLKEFLIKCNPYNQHSLSFESYLIKPVQRILKYQLFLQQIFISNNIDEIEKLKLKKSIKIMNKISKYINSMLQIYEDFGQSFESFIKNYKEQYNKIFDFNISDLYAYGEIDWINIYQFISKKNYQYLKTFCFIFRNGCFLLVREQLNKNNQNLLLNDQVNGNISDCFIRFLSIKELQVELLNDDNKHCSNTWRLIQTHPTTRLKTYFHFANKDAYTFVNTINNCILTSEYMHISESSNALEISSNQKRLLSSHSCYDFSPKYSSSNLYSEKNNSVNNRRSPSPIWKRRKILLRKRPLSMIDNNKFN